MNYITIILFNFGNLFWKNDNKKYKNKKNLTKYFDLFLKEDYDNNGYT